jgi:Stress responsive A/B Barrel Domain
MSKVWHIVLFQTTPGTTPERVQQIRGMFEECVGQVDGLEWVRTGSNNSASDFAKGWDEAVVMQFSDVPSRDAYIPHPLHQRVSAEARGGYYEELAVFDMEVGDG